MYHEMLILADEVSHLFGVVVEGGATRLLKD